MGDIPLMRAGLLLMVVIAIVGGLSMLVLPDGRSVRGRDDDGKEKDRDRVESVAAAPDAASPVSTATQGGLACRPDAASVQLPDAVHESSGVALAGSGDAVWTHNDSGRPALYLVGLDGRLRGEVAVTGASVTDWEDLAAGPCPGSGRCLYIADIGDNQAARPNVTIYRVPEPAPGATRTQPAAALTAAYPDGAHDAEALLVLPDGAVYIVTKGETGPVAVYELPRTARPGTVARMRQVAVLSPERVSRSERITGAAASPDGQWLAMRTLRTLRFYPTGNLSAGTLGTPLTHDLRPLREPQGEAVALGADGGVYLSSEGGGRNTPATLSHLSCSLPQP